MRQVIQSYRTGEVSVSQTPAPACGPRGVLVQNRASLISLGTERTAIELGKKSLLGKARARPDLVKRALEKARRDGFWRTYQEAMGLLDSPTPLGYSCAGVVLETGSEIHGFAPGERVACVGQGYACHADFVNVPANLVAKIPDTVSDDEAAFGMLGTIALHGVRSAKLQFGAKVAVMGLGLLGLLTVQLLRAYGCQVVCMDPAPDKVAMAEGFGVDAAVATSEALMSAAEQATGGLGLDAVIITASTKSDGPVNTALKLCRPRGRIVVVGVADIHPDRNELWLKEVEIVVSKAAGPGSLDPIYELDGVDYPIGEVRWTEHRNLEEFLRLIADKRIDVNPLITHRFDIKDAVAAYSGLIAGTLGPAIGVILSYPDAQAPERRIALSPPTVAAVGRHLRVGVLGAGVFGKAVLLPALAKVEGVALEVLAASSSASAAHSAKRFGFSKAATQSAAVFDDPSVDAVIAATPHDQHAATVLQAIEAAKPLFIEKPLCVTPRELTEIVEALDNSSAPPPIMVGHNRRYSVHTRKLQSWLTGRKSPMVLVVRINAGFVAADHWVHSERHGRSRIVGEMTHFLDLIVALAGARIRRVQAVRVLGDDKTVVNNDNIAVILGLADGSVANLIYSAQGARATPRETIEIMSEGQTLTSVDFTTSARTSASGKRTAFRTSGAKSGYFEELKHFAEVAAGRRKLEPSVEDAIHVMEASFAIERALSEGVTVTLSGP
jgi:predicted dehydrogenase/NADPH:quinone reductase-like Zn-dependent oxidoreductase